MRPSRAAIPELLAMAEAPARSGVDEHGRVTAQLPPARFSATGFNTFGEKLTVYFDAQDGLGFLLHSNCGTDPLPCGPGRGPCMPLTAPMDETTGVLVTPAKHQAIFQEALRQQGSVDETLWVEFAWCFGEAVVQREGRGARPRCALASPTSPESHEAEAATTPLHTQGGEPGTSPAKDLGRPRRRLERQLARQPVEDKQRLDERQPEHQLPEERQLLLKLALKQEQQPTQERQREQLEERERAQGPRQEQLRRVQQQSQGHGRGQQRPWSTAEEKLGELTPGEEQRRREGHPLEGQQLGKRRRLRRQQGKGAEQCEQQQEQHSEQQAEQEPEQEPEQQIVALAPAGNAVDESTGAAGVDLGQRRRRSFDSLRGLDLVELPIEDAADPGAEVSSTGRPRRRRLPPLQAWRNERLEYERPPGSATPSVKRVIRNEAGRRRRAEQPSAAARAQG
mmetsp:Transcript_17322/g.52191  ORF Transcript_17322/g.52191 Transcript_17322/m.52191 type:complete len:452 (+) Transcript_17322:1-1356(+)